MRQAIQYLVIIIALFGPKFGVIDSRILILIVFLFFPKNSYFILTKKQISLLFILMILTIYSLILFLILPPYPEFLRYLRALISLICLPYILSYQNNFENLLKMLVNSILLHPISIYLSMISPSFYDMLAKIYQLVTQIKELRYSGLTAGYDIAGYLSISGFLICIFIYFIDKSKLTLLKSFFFYFSVFFTSRTSIILLLFITTLLFFYFLVSYKFTIKKLLFLTFIISFLSIFVYKYIFPNLISTIDLEIFSDLSDRGNEDAIYIYAKTNPIQMFLDFVILPKTNIGIIFGENYLPLSDSGYIKVINSVGIFGLLLSILFYYKLFNTSRYYSNKNLLSLNLSRAFIIIILITLILNSKNQYLFTRGSFELLIIIYIVLTMNRNLKNNNI